MSIRHVSHRDVYAPRNSNYALRTFRLASSHAAYTAVHLRVRRSRHVDTRRCVGECYIE